MKKIACAVLILIMAIFLISPLSGEAGGGHGGYGGYSGHGGYRGYGGHGGYRGYSGHGGYSGWWVPWAVLGGAAVLAPYYYTPYYYTPYYSPYYPPQTVIIREQPPVYFQPAPSVTPSSTEKIFIYPRQGQSEELQAKDRYECHTWAVGQTGYDPTQPSARDMTEARRNQMRADYQRAQGACLDGRGYTMK